jgi:DNA-binding transcriptional ArsR family regulator
VSGTLPAAINPQGESFELTVSVLKAMGSTPRAKILALLASPPGKEMQVGEIVAMSALSQSATSQHLAILRKAGLVKTRKHYNFILYSLNDMRVRQIFELLMEERQN